MALLHHIRQQIIGKLTQSSPTSDFSLPWQLLDADIFAEAHAVRELKNIKLRRASWGFEPWATTVVTGITPVLNGSYRDNCDIQYNRYSYTLPFPIYNDDSFRNGIVSLRISDSNVLITPIATQALENAMYAKYAAPSYANPRYTDGGSVIYIYGGERDFTAITLTMTAVAASPVYVYDADGFYSDTSIVVPIPDDLITSVVEAVVNKWYMAFNKGEQDLVKDGVLQPDSTLTGRKTP
ncbi:MAG: hypothetical protein [Bacteriophage sp.]|nr:MAG: hypothetical protein [Bacteriophage sp.]